MPRKMPRKMPINARNKYSFRNSLINAGCGATIVHALQEATIVYVVIFKSTGDMMRNAAAGRHSGILPVDSTALIFSSIPIRRHYTICTWH
jgi:hypothetical protein